MISVPLSGSVPLSHTITYSISPLFELAASLHLLTRSPASSRQASWAEEMRSGFREERIWTEWEYFSPLFRSGVPDFLSPLQTKGVTSIEDQYDYFVRLSPLTVLHSLGSLRDGSNSSDSAEPIFQDAKEDADFVKGRFSLFLSSYWQLFFETIWETIAPRFVQEAERITLALYSPEELVACLKTITPGFFMTEEETQQTLVFDDGSPEQMTVRQFTLYPSYFSEEMSIQANERALHLIYPLNK